MESGGPCIGSAIGRGPSNRGGSTRSGRLLARRQLPVGGSDLPARQPAAEGAAAARPHQAAPSGALGNDPRFELHLRPHEPRDQDARSQRDLRHRARPRGTRRRGQRVARGHLTLDPKTVLDVLRNATYTGKLPFNGDLYQANHEPIIDEQPFERAQKLLEMRAESLPSRAANASNYLLTGLLQCARCGHGFIGTNAHGRGGVYRYYTCYSRQRHGTARCDQERIPAEPLEEAIVAEALAALDDGSIFLEAAKKADEARTVARSDEEAERRELSAEVASKREAIDRYLKAFETGKLPPSACGHRLEELHKEIEVFEKRSGVLEAELADTTTAFSDRDLVKLKHEIGAALLGAGPEQVKELLSVVVREIRVQCRSSIQLFFVAPGVRTPAPQRRRTGIEPAHRGSPGAPVLKTGRDTSPLSPPGDRGPIRPGAANSTGSAGGAAPNRRSGPRGPRLRAVPA